jgi:hypothetical protein
MPAEKYTLLTNIQFAQLIPDMAIRVDCSAILISENQDALFGGAKEHTVRGFGPDSSWPVFTQWLKPKALPFKIISVQDNSKIFIGHDGKERPLFKGNSLMFADGKGYFLQAANAALPIDVVDNLTDITEIWGTLETKCCDYWEFSNMPGLIWDTPNRIKGLRHRRGF